MGSERLSLNIRPTLTSSLNHDFIDFLIVNDDIKKIWLSISTINNETQIAMIAKELIASQVSEKQKIRLTTATTHISVQCFSMRKKYCLREFLMIL